ncbi:hypothetical protein [Allobaculum stercoricanis]|uniref:hypothetical protein n=1 Tax=Allobaculum stercoricanis TaxID=174709 RepID=UPI00037A7281|nr:hypothetical protein [Allobaculum stercoricanis]
MKKVKRKHQHNKSTSNPSIQSQTPDRLVQQDDLQKVKPKDNVELVQQEQDILSFYDSKEDDSIQLQGENADSKSLEQTILESLLEQDNQYEIKSEQNLEDDQTDNETSLETEEPVKLQRSLRRQALQVQKQKRSLQEWIDILHDTIISWSQYPIFTTFAGRFTIISLLACSGFALLLTVLLAGCHQDFELTNQTFVMELGTDVYANPALYINDPDQIDVSKLSVEPQTPGITILENRFVSVSLDYLGVGTYDFVMKEGREETPFVIKVKDTQPPTLQSTPSEVTVDWGQQPDWQAFYGGTDLSGVYYEMNQNIWTEAGEHDIEVKIRDRFGNALTRSLKVTVKP